MQKIGFAEALDSIVATDKRYSREAYVFLRDALDKLGWLCSRGKWILTVKKIEDLLRCWTQAPLQRFRFEFAVADAGADFHFRTN
jgi:hypothetical protein